MEGQAMAQVIVMNGRQKKLMTGHPWVYGDEIERVEGEPEDGGVVIMPRLALASYAILACCLASLSALLWFLFRNRQCASILRQFFFAPVSYLAGHLLIKGFHARTFFLEDDLGCILLVGAAVYALLTLGWTAWQQRKRDKGTEPLQN